MPEDVTRDVFSHCFTAFRAKLENMQMVVPVMTDAAQIVYHQQIGFNHHAPTILVCLFYVHMEFNWFVQFHHESTHNIVTRSQELSCDWINGKQNWIEYRKFIRLYVVDISR